MNAAMSKTCQQIVKRSSSFRSV